MTHIKPLYVWNPHPGDATHDAAFKIDVFGTLLHALNYNSTKRTTPVRMATLVKPSALS